MARIPQKSDGDDGSPIKNCYITALTYMFIRKIKFRILTHTHIPCNESSACKTHLNYRARELKNNVRVALINPVHIYNFINYIYYLYIL